MAKCAVATLVRGVLCLFFSAFSCLYNFPVCTTHDYLLLEGKWSFLSLLEGITFTLLVWKPCVFSLAFICIFERLPPFVEIQAPGALNRHFLFPISNVPYINCTANQRELPTLKVLVIPVRNLNIVIDSKYFLQYIQVKYVIWTNFK